MLFLFNRLLYVSTLDGKISALDLLDDGQKKWTINTTPGPMISSSIQNLELTNNGQWVRMIPSLSGAIYKFDGETVEPIPINADNLLSSSYKFSDELVISGEWRTATYQWTPFNDFFICTKRVKGGKETISYGVSAQSGQIIYECSMRGCINSTEINQDADNASDRPSDADSAVNPPQINDDEVIVVRRKTQTVRAIEPRTGEERWNFSVGQHEIESIQSPNDCHASSRSTVHDLLTNLDLRVIVPEGVICAVRKSSPNDILWKYKFDHPIVNVWKRDENNHLTPIDLFETVQGMWQFEGKSWTQSTDATVMDQQGDTEIKPSIYIGMFKRQLYIQESEQLHAMQAKVIDHIVDDVAEKKSFARIPWRPIDASSTELAAIEHESEDDKSLATTNGDKSVFLRKNYSATAISILYGSEYVNGNGFYLYAKSDDTAKCNKGKTADNSSDVIITANGTSLLEENERVNPAQKIVKWWYCWREIILIVLTVLVFNVVLTQRKPSHRVSSSI